MTLPADQLEELKAICDAVRVASEGGFTFVRFGGLRLPKGLNPSAADAILCPQVKDGYHSRLYFSSKIQGTKAPNWNGRVRILEENWEQYSYQLAKCDDLRLIQMVMAHVRGI